MHSPTFTSNIDLEHKELAKAESRCHSWARSESINESRYSSQHQWASSIKFINSVGRV